MRDIWYADKRDLVKWAVLFQLVHMFKMDRILQIAYYNNDKFEKVTVDDKETDMSPEVIAHFRNIHAIKNIKASFKITVFDKIFQDRGDYLAATLEALSKYPHQKCVIFLDPDTGLEPEGKPSLKHILKPEVRKIWEKIKRGDIMVFYQHRMRNKKWINIKKQQLESAIGASTGAIKLAHGLRIVNDVVFFYIIK